MNQIANFTKIRNLRSWIISLVHAKSVFKIVIIHYPIINMFAAHVMFAAHFKMNLVYNIDKDYFALSSMN